MSVPVDAPTLHVFVKGYATINGEEREVYRRQVPPSSPTQGQWVTVIDDMNPQNGRVAVEKLRVDLYIYLKSGTVLFDDVMLKAVGAIPRVAGFNAVVQIARIVFSQTGNHDRNHLGPRP